MEKNNRTEYYLSIGMTVTALLAVFLCVLMFMLLRATAPVKINLNGGNPVISEYEYEFKPDTTVEKTFYVENEGSQNLYYKMYFNHVSGELADLLEVTILNGEIVLYSGTAKSLTRNKVKAVNDILCPGERRYLTIRFHMPNTAESTGKDMSLSFDFCVDAVQMQNNPNKDFN